PRRRPATRRSQGETPSGWRRPSGAAAATASKRCLERAAWGGSFAPTIPSSTADDFMALKARGEARMLSAAWAIDQKRSPEPDLTPALTDFERASRMNSNDFGVYEL